MAGRYDHEATQEHYQGGDSGPDHDPQEAADAAAAIKAQNARRICNECSHVWEGRVTSNHDDPEWQALATYLTVKCPECDSEDTISEADMLADQAEGGLPA